MSFSANLQDTKILARLKSELTKPVLEAATPRDFTASNWDTAASGGYGLNLDSQSANWPAHWTADEHDELCPILEAWGYRDLQADTVIDGDVIDPFTWADITERIVSGSLNKGCGYLLVDIFDNPGGTEFLGPEGQSHGRDGPITESVRLSITGRMPAGRRRDQMNFYTTLIAKVLRNTNILLDTESVLIFREVPLTALGVNEDQPWLEWIWETDCTRLWTPGHPFTP